MNGPFYCVYCLNPDAAELRHDKHSRPYIICRSCGARVFPRMGMLSVFYYAYASMLAEANHADLKKAALGAMSAQADSVRRVVTQGLEKAQAAIEKETKG